MGTFLITNLRPKLDQHRLGGVKRQPDEPQKKPALHSMKFWLVNRDPYNCLLYFIIIPI